jgi:glyoxylase-like metal-dependent hydrolase (beta-lactamase superfamily II)
MKRNIIFVFVIFLAGSTFARLVDVEKLSEHVLVLNFKTSGISNLVAVKGQKGLVMIDTEVSPSVMRPVKKEAEHIFERDDWAYVVNTHAHMHHAGGNSLFKEAKIIGHDNLPADMKWIIDFQKNEGQKRQLFENADRIIKNSRAKLQKAGPDEKEKIEGDIEFWKLLRQDVRTGFGVVGPSITFSERYTIDLGDIKLELIYFGKGHSDSDILVYIPQEKVLVTSGVCYGRLPGINGKVTLADIERSISVLDEFINDDVELEWIIPAHAEFITKKELELKRDYYKTMLEGLRSARQEGKSIEQAKEEFSINKKFPFFIKAGQDMKDLENRQNHNVEIFWAFFDS